MEMGGDAKQLFRTRVCTCYNNDGKHDDNGDRRDVAPKSIPSRVEYFKSRSPRFSYAKDPKTQNCTETRTTVAVVWCVIGDPNGRVDATHAIFVCIILFSTQYNWNKFHETDARN